MSLPFLRPNMRKILPGSRAAIMAAWNALTGGGETHLHTHAASDITSGVLSASRLPIYFSEHTVDFGSTPTTNTSLAVTGKSWVTSSSVIVAQVFGTTTDHSTPEDAVAESIAVTIGDLVVGVGFTIYAHAPETAFGQFKVHVAGAA